MVAPTAPSPPLIPAAIPPPETAHLSALSPSDRSLLLRLLTLDEDFPALAAQLTTESAAEPSAPLFTTPAAAPTAVSSCSVPSCLSASVPDLLSLLSWSTQPHIAAWLTYYHTVQDHHSRRLAITKLESLIKTSDSQVEQRRAATTLLRALDHKWPTRRAVNPDREEGRPSRELSPRAPEPTSAPPASPFRPNPASPSHSSKSLAAAEARTDRAGQDLLRITQQLASSLSAQATTEAASQTPSGFAPASPDASAAGALPPFPPPSITPDPSHSPTTLAAAIALDLHADHPGPAASTIRALATPEFMASDPDTLLDLIEAHLNLPDDAHISEPEHHLPGAASGYTDGCRIEIAHPARPFRLRMEFLKRARGPWLLDLLDTC